MTTINEFPKNKGGSEWKMLEKRKEDLLGKLLYFSETSSELEKYVKFFQLFLSDVFIRVRKFFWLNILVV